MLKHDRYVNSLAHELIVSVQYGIDNPPELVVFKSDSDARSIDPNDAFPSTRASASVSNIGIFLRQRTGITVSWFTRDGVRSYSFVRD